MEESELLDYILEDATDEKLLCSYCICDRFLRLIAAYAVGTCWVVYCSKCGKVEMEQRHYL